MLQAKKPPPEIEPSINRIKLPPESSIRPLSGIKELLAQAETNRGVQIELTWTGDKPDHIFVLDVQWDANLEEPFWSLYEDNAGDSNRVWSQPFAPSNIELLYDVLVMSCGAVAHSSKLSDILKSQPASTKEDWSKPIHSQSGLPANNSPSTSDTATKVKSAPTQQSSTAVETKPVSENNNQNINPGSTPPPGYGYPNYPPPGGTAMPTAGFPPAAYSMPPNMPPVPFPMPYPPNMVPGQPFVPMVAPPGWQYNSSTGANSTNPILPPVPGDQYAHPNMSPVNQPVSDRLSSLPVDASLFNKHNEISLANLLRDAELITEPALAAALKIQDLVQDGSLAVNKAAKILKQHSNKGQAIADYLDSPATPSTTKEISTPAQENRDKNISATKPKTLSKEMSAAFDLLETAGLLSKEDIATAKNVSRKEGGNLVSILEASKKLDEKTFSAAITCIQLQNEGLMKTEQCVIALNYCSRSRVGFDEALDELNWENPKHTKK